METLIINIPEKKSELVKQLLRELGVTFKKESASKSVPNSVTQKTIDDAHKGIGIGEPIKDINSYINSL
ncbi:hypothetical protein FFJ24_016645 [Pedobacter sp. KBS0701]|uniref:hypothetical protein n=1 Tax=Pedobacter sp. KBS0701 TaxID=2578106 RepID=UPI00110D903C|nr:hypothetical protein [Pedobacter sp. KBS0701]QDW26355.1 hypothetical protein FFJ24_016645 [Pedobacter sp. KBS0701]